MGLDWKGASFTFHPAACPILNLQTSRFHECGIICRVSGGPELDVNLRNSNESSIRERGGVHKSMGDLKDYLTLLGLGTRLEGHQVCWNPYWRKTSCLN